MKQSNRPRLALALLILLALAWLLPGASRAGASAAIPTIAPASIAYESEPNNIYQNATFILLDPVAGTPNTLEKTLLGTIDSKPTNDNKGWAPSTRRRAQYWRTSAR